MYYAIFYQPLRALGIVTLVSFLLLGVGFQAHAQSNGPSIVHTYSITGTQPVAGDIISFNREAEAFELSHGIADPNLFGVVVANPILVLSSTGKNVPVARDGDVLVNVTSEGGPISPGDYVTSSSVAGKGRKADSKDAIVLGRALSSFPTASSTLGGGQESGSIPVLLAIGPYPATTQADEGVGAKATTDTTKSASVTGGILLRYLLAAIVAVGSITIAFRNFGSSIRDGIVSVGRNPLAKSSIQSMVLLNAFLIALVSIGGLFIGFAILFLPL